MLERNIINSLGMKKKRNSLSGFRSSLSGIQSGGLQNDKITSEANAATLESI